MFEEANGLIETVISISIRDFGHSIKDQETELTSISTYVYSSCLVGLVARKVCVILWIFLCFMLI